MAIVHLVELARLWLSDAGQIYMLKPMILGVAVSAIALTGAAIAEGESPLDRRYAEGVRIARWAWSKERANVLYSLERATSRYDIEVFRPHDKPGTFRFTAVDGERRAYTWWGHSGSVFWLDGDRLYYAKYLPSRPGGEVVAVDLKAGKELWTSRLRAIEKLAGSSIYSNSVNLEATGDVVSVFGNETAGQYYELKDINTGETVGHKIYEDPPVGEQK